MERGKSFMDCLIFGAKGYLGSRIFDYFNTCENNVVIGTQTNPSKKDKNLKVIYNYRTLNNYQLKKLIQKFDIVIDATGISGKNVYDEDTVEIIKSNTLWPANLAKSCIETKTRLVWFSTYHCENFKISNEESIGKGMYALSKLLTESSIINQPKWDSFISIARLGNIIGFPGSTYLDKSNLFAFEIIRNLVNNKKAIIKSDPSTQIGFVAISNLLKSEIFTSTGFFKIYSKQKNSIYTITKTIQKIYEKLSGEKSEIVFKKKVNETKLNVLQEDLEKEIESMILYFLKEYCSSNI